MVGKNRIYEKNADNCSSEMNDLAGSCLALDLAKLQGEELDEFSRIDLLTHFYRSKMNSLSPQKRKIISSLVRHGKPLRINELTTITGLYQQNRTSVQVGRLVKEGILEKQEDGRYYLSSKDLDFHKWLVMRLTNFRYIFMGDKSEELIPDRKNPVSYFIANRKKID